jgi:hypothetical protein
VAEDLFGGFEDLGEYTPPRKRPAPAEPEDLLSDFEYVADVPTAKGYAREAVKEIAREAPKAAIASPLKGAAALQYENEKRANKTLLQPIIRGVVAKLKDPSKKNEALDELRGYRDSWIYGLTDDQKSELDKVITSAQQGEVDPDKLLGGFEVVKQKPIEERGAYKTGQAIETFLNEKLRRRAGYEDSFGLDIAGAIGSTGGSIAQGLVLGPVGLAAAGALQGVDEQLTRAKESGLTDEEAAKYAVQGAGPGAVGMLSVEFLLRKVPPPLRKKLLGIAADVAKSGAAEATTEALQQVLQNGIESQYNKDRGLLDGTIYAGALGGSSAMALRMAVLGATRGRGVRGGGGGGTTPDPVEVQKELAEEELRLRQKEAGTKPKDAPAKTPEEAVKKGQVETAGEPATLTLMGQRAKGFITKRREDGGFDFVDQDGVVTIIDAADLKDDAETGTKAVANVVSGWKSDKSNEEIEKELKEWFDRENPWVKKTVELGDGTKFKAIEGPPDAAGNRTFRDGNGNLRQYPAEEIDVTDDWDADALAAPEEPVGEIAASKARMPDVTEGDVASPIPTDLIADGKRMMAETEGSSKADSILQEAGLPKVGTQVQFTREDGSRTEAVIHDATDDHVEILTNAGENLGGKLSQIAPRISQIPVEVEAQPQAATPETLIPLPSFLEPGGKLTRNEQEQANKSGEIRGPDFLYKSPVQQLPEPEEVKKGDSTNEGRQGATGVQQGQGVGNAPQQERGIRTGVRNQEVSGAPRKSEEVRTQEGKADEREAKAPSKNAERQENAAYDERRRNVRDDEKDTQAKKQERKIENVQPSRQVQSQKRVSQAGQESQADIQRNGSIAQEQPAVQRRDEVTEGQGTKGIQQEIAGPESAWWDKASVGERRAAAVRAGYATTIGGKLKRVDALGERYATQSWKDIPEAARKSIQEKNVSEINKTAATPEAVPPPREMVTATETKPNIARREPAYEQKGDFIVSKGGRGFGTKADALSVKVRLGKEYTVKEVQGTRGWVVARKEPLPEVKEEIAPQPEPVPEKVKANKRITKKDYDQKREEVRTQLREELDKRGLKDVKLETPDSISEIDGSKSITGDSNIAVGRSRGNLIEVALSGEHDYRRTLRHESLHAIRNLNLFKDAEWKALEREASSDRALMDDVRDRYAGENLTEEALIEEAIADKFADYVEESYQPKGFVRSAFEKIKNLIKALSNALRGNGFQSASDIFSDIEKGKIGERPRAEKPSHIAIAEAEAGTALRQLENPLEGLVSPAKYAKVRRHEDKFVRDMGIARSWLITPRTIAAFSRSFAKVYIAAKKQFAHRDQVISDLAIESTPYRHLKEASRNKVNKVLELGRLEQKVYSPGANGEITVTSTGKTGLMEAGESVTLNAEEVAGYKSVRSMMDKALDEFKNQTIRDFGFDPAQVSTSRQALALIQPGMTKADKNKIRTMAKMIHDIDQSRRTGYIPFSRFGNIVVVAEDIDPVTGKSTTLHSETVEVTGLTGKFKDRVIAKGYISRHPDVKKLVSELTKSYPNANIRHFQVGSSQDTRPDNAKDILGELIQLTPSELEERVKELHTKSIASGFRKHFFHAKNVPGYSVDIERSIADYMITMGSFVARRQSAKEWNDAINAIPSNKPKEKAYAQSYREYTNSPVEEFAAIRQIGFITFLAGNISNAIANMTQVPLVSAPYLNMFSSSARIAFELSRAYKDATMMLTNDVREVFNPDKAPIDVRAALKQAWAEGQFTPLAMHEIMGVAYHARPSQRWLSAAGGKLLDRVAYPQTSTERLNRLVTFMAAYRLANKDTQAFEAKARPILEGNALAAETVLKSFTPSEFARYVVDETQFDVGKVNRSTITRGIGAAIFQFKPFIFNSLELHAKLAKLHGLQGMKAWVAMIAGLMVAGGAFAPPASEDLVWITEMLLKWWDGVDRDIKLGVREYVKELTGSQFVSELASKGVFSAAGIDMSNRVGMGKIVPRTTEELGGIPASLAVGRGQQIASNVKDGRWMEAMMSILPLVAKNMIEPWVWKNDGVRTRLGDPVLTPEEITPWEMAPKTFGFMPSKVSERREMEWSQQRAAKAVGDLQAKYYRRLARVLNDASESESDEDFSKHMDKYEEILLDIEKHNDKYLEKNQPHKLIVIEEKTLKKRMAAEVVGRGAIRETTAPKKARPRQQEIREAFGGE